MPTLSFEGETHDELLRKVRKWLVSAEGAPEHLGAIEVVERVSDLTNDALSIIAAAAPEPIAHSDIVQGLTRLGHEVTDETADAVSSGLRAISDLYGDRVIKRVEDARHSITYRMSSNVARRMYQTVKP